MRNEKSKERKKKKRPTAGEPHPLTKAVTHIRLVEVNPGKLAALDMLAPIYLSLCQQYVTLFCTTELPNKLRACRDRKAIKAVLMQRHEAWRQQQGMGTSSPVTRRRRGISSVSPSSI